MADKKTSTKKTTKQKPGFATTLETPSGKKQVHLSIAEQFPTVRPIPGKNVVVESDLLMRLAEGKKITEVEKKDLAGAGVTKEVAQDFLVNLALKESQVIKIL